MDVGLIVYSGVVCDEYDTEVLTVVLVPGIDGRVPVVMLNVGVGTGVEYWHCNILQQKSDGSETIWQVGGGATPSRAGHLQIIDP